MRAITILVLLSAAFAGCSGGGPKFVSAGDVKGKALELAARWSPDAEVFFVVGVELAKPIDLGPNGKAVAGHSLYEASDTEVGDGRAQAWWFEFRSVAKENASYAWILGPGGRTLETIDLSLQQGGLRAFLPHETPIEPWLIDSTAAADAASKNETWRDLAQAKEPGVLMGLVDDPEDDPYWVFHLADGAADLGRLSVNAKTGAVTELPPFLQPPAEIGGWIADNLTSVAASATKTIRLASKGHETLDVRLILDPPALNTRVNLTVRGPGTSARTVSQVGGVTETTFVDVEIAQPSKGDWTFTVELKQGAFQHYRIAWCARGVPPARPPPDDPCGNT